MIGRVDLGLYKCQLMIMSVGRVDQRLLVDTTTLRSAAHTLCWDQNLSTRMEDIISAHLCLPSHTNTFLFL